MYYWLFKNNKGAVLFIRKKKKNKEVEVLFLKYGGVKKGRAQDKEVGQIM